MVELVEEMQKLPQTPELLAIIEEAKAGEYHDYKNKKYDCGKVEVVKRLQLLGHFNLAQRVIEGEFDEDPDDLDKENMRRDIRQNTSSPEEAKRLFLVLGL